MDREALRRRRRARRKPRQPSLRGTIFLVVAASVAVGMIWAGTKRDPAAKMPQTVVITPAVERVDSVDGRSDGKAPAELEIRITAQSVLVNHRVVTPLTDGEVPTSDRGPAGRVLSLADYLARIATGPTAGGPSSRVQLTADKEIPYRTVLAVFSTVTGVGLPPPRLRNAPPTAMESSP